MKITSAFCDLHPSQRLAQGAVDLGRRYGLTDQQTLRCTRAGCGRHFHYDFGYFPVVPGAEPDFGDVTSKPKCRKGHDLLYMLLTKVDGALVYACFGPECASTVPYEGVGALAPVVRLPVVRAVGDV